MSKVIGETAKPMICTPIVGQNQQDVLSELTRILGKRPDIIEWRADFFTQIANVEDVLAVANGIKAIAGDTPVIFTIRSAREGGQPISLTDREVMQLNLSICEHTQIEYVDCELRNLPEDIMSLRRTANQYGTKIIGSFHNFAHTPSQAELVQKFIDAERYQLDVAKVAVMPNSLEDVLILLGATLEAKECVAIPLIVVSMGGYGVISRMIGGVFGSSLSFAVGDQSSAPGQIPIEDLQTVLEIIERSMSS